MSNNTLRFALAATFASPALAQTELWTTAIAPTGQRYGLVVSTVGDIDLDGVLDVAVGAPDSDLAGGNSGAVHLLSGATGAEIWALPGLSAGDSLGFSVAGLGGDVDGDGFPDLVAGARYSDLAGPDFGAAHVISGATGAIVFSVTGFGSNSRFGECVGAAGDVDADGTPDVIVGARLDAASGQASGAARVYSGATGTLLYAFFGDDSADYFGRAVGNAGDVDLDGHSDVFASAPGDDDAGNLSGSLRIYSGLDGSVLRRFDGAGSGDLFGGKATTFGDVNFDGVPEFAVGSISADLGGVDRGAVRVLDGATGAELYTLTGTALDAEFGAAVSAAGDVNLDGVPDLLCGARLDDDGSGLMLGSASVHSGIDGTEIWKVYGPSDFSQFGDTCAGLGDVDGDGFADVLVGAFGDDLVRTFSGLDPIGTKFCGPAVVNSTGQSAEILAVGSTTAADNDLRLMVSNAPAQVFGLMITSPDQLVIQNLAGNAGTICIASFALGRYPAVLQTSAAGTLDYQVDLTQTPGGFVGVPVLAGETRNWQFWFRDVPATANFTDAVSITFD